MAKLSRRGPASSEPVASVVVKPEHIRVYRTGVWVRLPKSPFRYQPGDVITLAVEGTPPQVVVLRAKNGKGWSVRAIAYVGDTT